jgi:hypothetical protein
VPGRRRAALGRSAAASSGQAAGSALTFHTAGTRRGAGVEVGTPGAAGRTRATAIAAVRGSGGISTAAGERRPARHGRLPAPLAHVEPVEAVIARLAGRALERHDGAPDREKQQEARDEDPGRAEAGDISP